MVKFLRLCSSLVIFAVCQGVQKIQGLSCEDPDSGKLYPVNSTWPSQTFCGNYTCKLRKKNITETQYAPVKNMNISERNTLKEDDIANDMITSPSENSIVINRKTENDKQPIFHKDLFKAKDAHPAVPTTLISDGDRYLSESEIKTITEMLHTVKKSDLEAIVELYNLATDIYKEIDSVSTDKLVKETSNDGKSENTEIKGNNEKQSFWYEPMHNSKYTDLSHEGTDQIPTKKPYESNPTFFKGPLTDKDFRKIPYYYPISDFQRLSSYIHSKTHPSDLENAPTETKPCKKADNNYNYVAIPWYSVVKKQEPQIIQPSTLLPYPFSYVYHYNISGYPSSYYYNYPWAQADYSKHRNYPYYLKPYNQMPNYSTFVRAEPIKEEAPPRNNLLDKLIKKPEDNLPDWQTDPLPKKVLDEVRAHVLDKPNSLKPIPFRKNVKLERVGKVIKLDELTRSKREIIKEKELNGSDNDAEEFEAYIVKITCEDSTEMGYFSRGNLTASYPACCPQKINNFTITTKNIK